MSIQRHISCGLCGNSFWQTVDRRSAPLPRDTDCPFCQGTGTPTEQGIINFSAAKRAADEATSKMVSERRGPGYNASAREQLRSEEMVFRAMDEGSKFRAELAAADLNVPVSEMSNIRITDMHDNPKHGEISAKVPMSQDALMMNNQARQMSFSSDAAQYATAHGVVMNQGTPHARAVGTQVGIGAKTRDPITGSTATPGMAAHSLVHSGHAQKAAEISARGQMNR